MTQKEFEERTGLNVNACEFESIHEIYMACGEMDKDTFCKEWKRHGESKLLAALWQNVKRQGNEIKRLSDESTAHGQETNALIDFMLVRAQKFGDLELLHKSISLKGYEYVIVRKLRLSLPLWEEDRNFLIKILGLKES